MHPTLDKQVLYCIVLYCIVLYCIVLHCIVLYCIVLYQHVLHCIVSANFEFITSRFEKKSCLKLKSISTLMIYENI